MICQLLKKTICRASNVLLGLGADEVAALVGSSEGEGDGQGRGEEEESQRHLVTEGWRSCIELGLKRGA